MVEVADKFRNLNFVRYPGEFNTEEDANMFKESLQTVAPLWRFRVVCIKVILPNAEAHTPRAKD